MALYNKEQIMEIIPHRDPFLLIDEVEELEVGKRVVATKFISPDSFWFQGHFPGHPVTPGVLIIEMLAQAGAVCALSMPENQGKIAFFAGIDQGEVPPAGAAGDTLRLEVEMLRVRGNFGMGQGDRDGRRRARRERRDHLRAHEIDACARAGNSRRGGFSKVCVAWPNANWKTRQNMCKYLLPNRGKTGMIVVVSKAGPPTAAPSVRSYEVPIERMIGGNNHGI